MTKVQINKGTPLGRCDFYFGSKQGTIHPIYDLSFSQKYLVVDGGVGGAEGDSFSIFRPYCSDNW